MKSLHLLLPFTLLVATAASADSPKPAPPKAAPQKAVAPTRIEIAVTKRGFDPDDIAVPAKKPMTLVFTRTTDATCTKTVVLTLDDGKKIERELPLNKPVEIAATFPNAGKLSYACSMDMVKGVITVQ